MTERLALKRVRSSRRVLPPVYFLAAILGEVLLHFLFPIHQVLAFPWRLLGLAFLAAGMVLNALADRSFKKHETTVKPFEESRALVTGGVFGISRHPMYLGMALMLLGLAALLGSAASFAVIPVFAVALDRIFIVQEERMLEETFGDRFRRYRTRVRRWI
jgi:protein-S-isoprenylcysteine O-methyltransferase Ste14